MFVILDFILEYCSHWSWERYPQTAFCQRVEYLKWLLVLLSTQRNKPGRYLNSREFDGTDP